MNSRLTPGKPHLKWLDVAVLLICITISYTNPVSFPWKVPIIAGLIIGYVFIVHRNLSVIGLGRFNLRSILLWGFIIAFTVIVGISNLFIPLLEKLLDNKVDTSAYGDLEGNIDFMINYWWKAMISAAFAEEVFYRGYLFFVFERIIGSGRIQRILIVLVTAVYFGWSHSFQGITGVIGISLAAIILGGGYYLSRKNLYAVILAHALIDTWALYSLYKGGINLFF
jgi:membrane protease YdiL (CAAX protease family)